MVHICSSGGVGCGTTAGLIGEQAALDAVHQGCAESAGHDLTQTEGLLNDAGEDAGQQGCVLDDDHEGDQDVGNRHDGDHDIQDLDGGVLTQDDHRSQSHQEHSGIDGLDVESVFKGGGDGVADDLADAAPADEACHAEEDGQNVLLAVLAVEILEVMGGAAAIAAVDGVLFLVQLGQGGFHECGGGADDGSDPHPEDRACAAGGDRRHDADHVAHANTGGSGDDESLETGEGAALSLFPPAEGQTEHFREASDQDKLGTDGKENTSRDQQEDQQGQADGAAAGQGDRHKIAPEEVNKCIKSFHIHSFFSQIYSDSCIIAEIITNCYSFFKKY